jgi:hypothetical protein
VQYAYSGMASGANNSRLTSMTYPSGRVLNFSYNTGIDSSVSRLSSISDTSATLGSSAYLGVGMIVARNHPQPGVNLTYSGTGPCDGGDQYVGLDCFGRERGSGSVVTERGERGESVVSGTVSLRNSLG